MKRDNVSENPRNFIVKLNYNRTNQYLLERIKTIEPYIDNLPP